MPAIPRYTGSHALCLREELSAHGGDYAAAGRTLEANRVRRAANPAWSISWAK